MPDVIKVFTAGNFWLGIGAAIAVSVLGPTLGKTAKPLATKGIHGMMVLGDKTGEMLKSGKEHIETMAGAGLHELSKKMPSRDEMRGMLDELKAQNRNATEEIRRLYHEIGDLKNQLEQLKPM